MQKHIENSSHLNNVFIGFGHCGKFYWTKHPCYAHYADQQAPRSRSVGQHI